MIFAQKFQLHSHNLFVESDVHVNSLTDNCFHGMKMLFFLELYEVFRHRQMTFDEFFVVVWLYPRVVLYSALFSRENAYSSSE